MDRKLKKFNIGDQRLRNPKIYSCHAHVAAQYGPRMWENG